MDDDARSNGDALTPWLALARAPGLGSVSARELLRAHPGPGDLFRPGRPREPATGLPDRARRALQGVDWQGVEADLRWLEQPAHHLVTLQDPRYPPLLAELGDAPPILFVNGDPALLDSPQVAIVGSRNPSPTGRETAREFAAFLAGAGFTITSGLATGIDGAAHRGALDVEGRTLAVGGTGPDRVYPASHAGLAREIAARGALVSEFPLGTTVSPGNFPRRNRVIAGLSLGTLVVEAARRSGSLITARLAAEQGREVFAIPGSIHNPLARGCHLLIRQGAKLVETGADIVEELGPLFGALETQARESPPPKGSAAGPRAWDADYRTLLDCLGYDPVSVDTLVARSGLTADKVSSMLLLLELEGHVSSAPGGRYLRTGQTPG